VVEAVGEVWLMIELAGVSKLYRTTRGDVRALDDVSLRMEQGDFVAVRGPSGCGKSTLLTLIGGLALPTAGTVVAAGEVVSQMSASARAAFRAKNVGFVFQMFHLLPYLDVLGNVLVASADGAGAAVREYASELLDRFGLGDRLHHRPGQLSAGERQRVAMARAMLNRPQILLADEPTGNLDPENAKAVLDLLASQVEAGLTIVLVTHEEHAARYAHRTILLRRGQIEAPAAA
jgi:ABC-type lipoprotein export system ATPase subunit